MAPILRMKWAKMSHSITRNIYLKFVLCLVIMAVTFFGLAGNALASQKDGSPTGLVEASLTQETGNDEGNSAGTTDQRNVNEPVITGAVAAVDTAANVTAATKEAGATANTTSTAKAPVRAARLESTESSVTKELVNGDTYFISSAADKSKVLDISGGSLSDGGNLQLFSYNATGAQRWKVVYDSAGNVTFVNVNSGKAMDVSGGVAKNETNVQQYKSNGTAAQKWIVSKNADGTYVIRSALNKSYALDLAWGATANGTNVRIYKGNGTVAQSWVFKNYSAMLREALAKQNESRVKAGEYVISSVLVATRVLDVANGSKSSGGNVQLYDSNMTAAQKWVISYDSSGYATITNKKSGLVLDASGGAFGNGTNVQQYKSNETLAQKWLIIKTASGRYKIASALYPGTVVDVDGGKKTNGTNIQLFAWNSTSAQQWYFLSTSPKVDPTSESTKKTIDTSAWYSIRSALDESYALDLASGSVSNGTNVQVYKTNGTFAQIFSFTPVSSGYYMITSSKANSAVGAASTNLIPGVNVQLYAKKSSDTKQLFSLVRNEDGSYSFINVATGLALSVNGTTAKNGSNIQLGFRSSGARNQRFTLKKLTALISDGLYSISPASNGKLCLDVKGASKEEGASVQIYSSNQTFAQKWSVKKVESLDNVYTVQSLASGHYLSASGSVVSMRVKQADGSQQWKLNIYNGTYVLTNVATGRVLDIASGVMSSGTSVQVYTRNNTVAQRWSLSGARALENGYYTVMTLLKENMVLDVADGSLADKANVQLYESNGTGAQKWRITQLSANVYSIVNAKSGKALGVANSVAADGTNIQQCVFDSSRKAQRWSIEWSDNGYFIIRSTINTEYVLDVHNGESDNGSNIQLYTANGTTAQAWAFTATAYESFYLYLDAGHGKSDPMDYDSGALGNGYKEADLTNELTRMIAEKLKAAGIQVHLSQDDGVNYTDRQAKAQSLGCTTLISIHFNSYDGQAHGSESYISTDYASPGSAYLQQVMHEALVSGTKLTDRGKKTANYAVLHGGLPATLLEVAFIDNASDMSAYQKRKADVAVKLANGIIEYSKSVYGAVDAGGASSTAVSDYSIMGKSQASAERMVALFNSAGHAYPHNTYSAKGAATIEDFCNIVCSEAETEGVRAEVVFAQAMLETGWLQFGGDVKAAQCNFCGLGATGNGVSGADFSSYGAQAVRTGIRAQVQHLKAYGSSDGLVNTCVDPRWDDVVDTYGRGSATTVMALSQKWAANSQYGASIVSLINNLLRT